jgi:hypothetical protein
MQVVSLAPVPVASLCWRQGSGPWTLTVVCKLTVGLAPGQAVLAKRHDPVHERDQVGDTGAAGSLLAPSDLVPARPLCDVTLVGEAYAPGGGPLPAFTARLRVQSLDKALQLEAQGGDGLRNVPLAYESAVRSASNPIGADDGAKNRPYRILPASQLAAVAPERTSPGFGPVAAHWPARHGLLRGGAPPEPPPAGEGWLLSDELDLGFFNAAPPDQQLPELDPSAELVLENLHPDLPLLRTRLPNVAPQVFVERNGSGRRQEIAPSLRGLWIDTRRGLATLTWLAPVPLAQKDEPGRVWVAVAGAGRRLTQQQLHRLIGTLQRRRDDDPLTIEPDDEETTDESGEPLKDTHALRRKHRDAIVDDGTQTSVLSREVAATRDALSKASQQARESFARRAERTAEGAAAMLDDGLPAWLPRRPPSMPPPPPRRGAALAPEPTTAARGGMGGAVLAAPRSTAAPIPPSPLERPTPLPAQPPSLQSPPSLRSPPSVASPPIAPPSLASTADRPSVPPVRPPALTHPGIGPASMPGPWLASAERAARLEDTSSLPKVQLPEGRAPRRTPTEVVQLLWLDADATERLRLAFPELCNALEFAPRDNRHDLPDRDPSRARAHHLHFGVLTETDAVDARGLELALRDAVSETGRFTPPLCVLRGLLRFPFDEVEVLRATAAALIPITGDDKKLAAALDQVKELLATPLVAGSSETVANFTRHLRKLYESTRRTLPLEYLDDTVERMLLADRRYQKRSLFGGTWIRALLTLGSVNDKPMPAYLPEELASKLPMMVAFNARLLAEAHVKQDQYEPHPHALRVVTLGRAIKVET